MDPRLPRPLQRRKGFYIPSRSRKSPKTSFSDEDSPTSKSKSIEWKFIKKPSPSRLSLEPEGGQKYLFSDRTIEKMAFGDYFLMKYLERNTKNACFIYPDLMLVVDAIDLFYQMKDMGIPGVVIDPRKDGIEELDRMIQKYPSLIEKYERTREIIQDNLREINSILKPNEKGPRLERTERHYSRLIYSLIERMMDKQKIEFDTMGKDDFMIPYESKFYKCLKSGKRYIVFFLRLKINDSYHANMMIIDTKKKTVERFEPQGSEHEFYDNQVVDDKIRSYFEKIGYEYIDPTMMKCPYGVQDIVESYTMDKYKFSGFCKIWSFLYGLLRLHLDDMDQKNLVNHMNLLVKETARSYFEERHGKTILEEDYENYDFVIEFLYDYIPKILEEGKEDIKIVNKILGTNIVLEGRTLRSQV